MAKMGNTVPFVQAACIADKILIEQDDVVSAIRITDTFTVTEPANIPPGGKPAMVLSVYVALKSGDVAGQFDLELLLRRPNGETKSFGVNPVTMQGGISGLSVRADLTIVGLEYGPEYWIDVLWGPDKVRLSSIPFRFKQSAPKGVQVASA